MEGTVITIFTDLNKVDGVLEKLGDKLQKMQEVVDASPAYYCKVSTHDFPLQGYETPEKLYHYTSRHVLLSILDKGEIWASHICYLNDAAEFAYAVDRIMPVVASRNSHTTDKDEPHALDLVVEYLQVFRPGMARHVLLSSYGAYVFSLSENPDQLSQWRGYCKPGDGYALGFHSETVLKGLDTKEYLLLPCQYDQVEQDVLLSWIIDRALTNARDMQAMDPALKEFFKENVLAQFLSTFFELAPIIKHRSFKEEKEWRLYTRTKNIGIKLRPGRSLLVPYHAIDLKPLGTNLGLAEIVIGPTPYPLLDANSLLMTIAKSVKITLSKIPFREL